jgi:hypothetical protein
MNDLLFLFDRHLISIHLRLNFVGAASPRSSSFLTFVSLGYPPGGYSEERRLSTGLVLAARMACALTVSSAIPMAPAPAIP